MNFFEHQARARRQTHRLVLLFSLAVLGTVGLVVGAVALMLRTQVQDQQLMMGELALRHWPLLALSGLAVLCLIGFAALYKTASLRSGGSAVARSLGATPLAASTRDLHERRLRNVVEEIAIASGVPVPAIFVMQEEAGINAFAAGWSTSDAAVCVTRGCLEKLNRDELQGVIAHEFSHILNGDMRLNVHLMGVLFGILVLAVVGREMLEAMSRGRSNTRGKGGGLILIPLAAMVAGYVGLFFGRLIKASVSRQREFLADSSAVQFTRQAQGIAGALKKIGGLTAGSKLNAGKGEEVSHMLFGDGVGYSRLFATHPPLLERIKRIEPRFDQAEIASRSAAWNAPGYRADDLASDAPVTSRLSGTAGQVTPKLVIEQVAHPSGDDYQYAEAVHAAMPAALREAAESESQAWALNFALVLDRDEAIRKRQLEAIKLRAGAAASEASAGLRVLLAQLPPAQRLPLAALSFPQLRQRPRAELLSHLALLHQLVRADGQVGLFEFCLGTLLRVQLSDALNPSQSQVLGPRRLAACQGQALSLLAVLASRGHKDEAQARKAFMAGVEHLFPRQALRYEPPAEAVPALDTALPVLDQLNGPGKQLLIEALVLTLNHDKRVTVAEAELLRALCAALHCPLPPVLRE